jgi:hypothetical protein
MRKIWAVRGFGIVLLLTIAIAGFGEAVLQLWNWLMPGVFGLHPITFWQAVGLLALSWILVGRFGGFGYGGGWRQRRRERWERMTPDEREKFRRGMASRCGHFQQPAADPKA